MTLIQPNPPASQRQIDETEQFPNWIFKRDGHNVADNGAKSDDSDNTDAFQKTFDDIAGMGIVVIPSGDYRISKTVSVTGKHIYILGQGVRLYGEGSFVFDSEVSALVSASDVTKYDNTLTTELAVNAGDYIQLEGDIVQDGFPSDLTRYPHTKFVAKVIAAQAGVLHLDRKIDYGLTTVTVCKIMNPYRFSVGGDITFEDIQVTVNRCIGGSSEAVFTGSRGGVSAGLYYNQSCDFSSKFTSIFLSKTFGMVINDSNNFEVDFRSTRGGMSDGSGSKSFRANGIQNARIRAMYTDSPDRDSTIYAARDLSYDVKSIGGGRYYRENNITTGNRLESVQFSECDDIDVTIDMVDADDQGIEFLSVTNSSIRVKQIHTLDNATEAAILLKMYCSNVTINGEGLVNCHNPYGIKLECQVDLKNIVINNLRLINRRPDGSGIYMRDSGVPHDIYCDIVNPHITAPFGMTISRDHNHVTVTNPRMISTIDGGHCIQGLGDYLTVIGGYFTGTNDILTRSVVSSGANDQVRNITSTGAIYIRDRARFNLSLTRYTGNQVPRIYVDKDLYSFYIGKTGEFRVATTPAVYTLENGTKLFKQFYQANDIEAWTCVNGGSQYPAWVSGESVVVEEKRVNEGNVYKVVIPAWSSGETVSSGTIRTSYNGFMYIATTSGTTGTLRPFGTGTGFNDGGVTWDFYPTLLTGATPPTGTGTGISDGTVNWDYVSAMDTYTLNAMGSMRARITGQVTITAGLTQVTVTHNAPFTATDWDFSCNKNLTGGTAFIDSVTSTTMILHLPAVQATDVFCTWWIEGN